MHKNHTSNYKKTAAEAPVGAFSRLWKRFIQRKQGGTAGSYKKYCRGVDSPRLSYAQVSAPFIFAHTALFCVDFGFLLSSEHDLPG